MSRWLARVYMTNCCMLFSTVLFLFRFWLFLFFFFFTNESWNLLSTNDVDTRFYEYCCCWLGCFYSPFCVHLRLVHTMFRELSNHAITLFSQNIQIFFSSLISFLKIPFYSLRFEKGDEMMKFHWLFNWNDNRWWEHISLL